MASRKSGRDRAGHLDPDTQRRRRFERVLRLLGLWDTFVAMPRSIQDLIVRRKFPDPVLEFDASFPDDADGRALRKTLEKNFAEAGVDLLDEPIAVRDFYSVVAGLFHAVRFAEVDGQTPPACLTFLRDARPLLDELYEENVSASFDPLHAAILRPLIARSRLDARLLTATFKQEGQPNGKYLIRITARSHAPEARHVVLDERPRPMYRVGVTHGWDGLQWTVWPDGQRPVYIQSHALRHLRERLNLPQVATYLEAWLTESLKDPVIVERQGPDALVEFRIRRHRVGYLVVTPLADCAAVRTFKFLTMENTPEARKLEKRLRLSRPDVNWLRLHELESYTNTDLRNDPLLRRLMEECGCGHLFALAEESDFAPELKPFAAELRRYLGKAA